MTIAVDFDGTLCESAYPRIGAPKYDAIEYIKQRKRHGDKIILWTCRTGIYLRAAIQWCRRYGIVFDSVNENLGEHIKVYKHDCRKVFADLYIDDKALNASAIGNSNSFGRRVVGYYKNRREIIK